MSLHGGHIADSGPSADYDLRPEGTGLSRESAAFVAAHCSPFSNPRDMPVEGAKVPDPRNTQSTCSATISQTFQFSAGMGKTILIMNADPLAELPLTITQHDGLGSTTFAQNTSASTLYWDPVNNTRTFMDPKSWGQLYDQIGFDRVFAKTKALAEQASQYRIVGCGLRVNMGADQQDRIGLIEAGQIEWSDSRDNGTVYTTPQEAVTTDTTNNYLWRAFHYQKHPKTKAKHAIYGTNSYQEHKKAIRAMKNQFHGMLKSTEGACVRWTDIDNFRFKKAMNRNLVGPDNSAYENGYFTSQNTPYETGTNDPYIWNVNGDRSNGTLGTGIQKSPLCVKTVTCDQAAGTTRLNGLSYLGMDSAVLYTSDPGNYVTFSTRAAYADETLGEMEGTDDFSRGLYVDISGLSANHNIMVEVSWIIEYIPRLYALDQGLSSPVDMNFQAIQAMVQDPEAYPIIVKGNSFFSSLWAGVKKAAGVASGILQGTSNIASLVPHPGAQAFAAGAATFGSAFGMLGS